MKDISGQMSLFDIFNEETVSETDVTDYLQKGEKILSLMRKKQEKHFFKKDSFMELFNFNSYAQKKTPSEKMEYLLSQIRKHRIRPAMDMLQNGPKNVMADFFGSMGKQLKVELLEKGCYADTLLSSFYVTLKNAGNYTGGIKVAWEKDEWYIPYGSKARLASKQHLGRYRMKRPATSPSLYVADAGLFFGWPCLLVQLRRHILTMLQKDECGCWREKLQSQFDGTIDGYVTQSGKISVRQSAYSYSFVRDSLSKYEIEIVPDEDKKNRTGPCMESYNFVLPFLYSEHVEEGFFKCFFGLRRRPHDTDVLYAFEMVFGEYLEDKALDVWKENMKKEHARSFQTKKNISRKTIQAMQDSILNRWFGYIEFDDDVDIAVMYELEKEWKALADYMQFKKSEDVSLRFRKLGNHKAAGLYYPFFNCICIDLNNPSSMLHEYMHMLDYKNGELSRKPDFFLIKDKYKECVQEIVDKDEELKKRLSSSTKYNLTYYFTSTEIFARCGEIYLTRILHVDNSLVKPEESFAYPEDSVLLELIRNYFDDFLGIYSQEIQLKEVV